MFVFFLSLKSFRCFSRVSPASAPLPAFRHGASLPLQLRNLSGLHYCLFVKVPRFKTYLSAVKLLYDIKSECDCQPLFGIFFFLLINLLKLLMQFPFKHIIRVPLKTAGIEIFPLPRQPSASDCALMVCDHLRHICLCFNDPRSHQSHLPVHHRSATASAAPVCTSIIRDHIHHIHICDPLYRPSDRCHAGGNDQQNDHE